MHTDKQQQAAAAAFARKWEGRGYEKGESQTFWVELLTEVFGVESPSEFIRFEQQAQLDHTSFIDGIILGTHVLIEQKSLGKDLRQAIRQSDGTVLTPFQQAQRYSAVLPYKPFWMLANSIPTPPLPTSTTLRSCRRNSCRLIARTTVP